MNSDWREYSKYQLYMFGEDNLYSPEYLFCHKCLIDYEYSNGDRDPYKST